MPADKEPLKILIAISNNILSEGLRRIIEDAPGRKLVFLKKCPEGSSPEVILFDHGLNLSPLQALYPNAKSILLDTGLKDQEITRLLVNNNVRGVISPETSIEMFYKAIRRVAQGEIWVDQKQLKALLQRNHTLTATGDIKSLSLQDKKIVRLVAQGYKNREIGETLCLSEHTIKAHLSRIFKRMNVANRAQLVSLAEQDNG